MRSLRPSLPVEPVIRFETEMGEQLQVDWVEFRKGSAPLRSAPPWPTAVPAMSSLSVT